MGSAMNRYETLGQAMQAPRPHFGPDMSRGPQSYALLKQMDEPRPGVYGMRAAPEPDSTPEFVVAGAFSDLFSSFSNAIYSPKVNPASPSFRPQRGTFAQLSPL